MSSQQLKKTALEQMIPRRFLTYIQHALTRKKLLNAFCLLIIVDSEELKKRFVNIVWVMHDITVHAPLCYQ
jgi:hypothetical protein